MSRTRVLTLALALASAPLAAFAAATVPPADVAIVGGTLVDGTGAAPLADAVVLVHAGRIACAGARVECPVPAGVRVIDATGRWVTPGLVDAHVHFSQTGWADGRPDALDARARYPYVEAEADLEAHPERFSRSYLCSGVTAVFDVGGYPWTFDLARATAGAPDAPRVAAAGPLLSTIDFWLNLPAERQILYLSEPADAETYVRYLAARGADAVKLWFIPEDRPFEDLAALADATGAAAHAAGLRLLVHATGLREAEAALHAGADVLVHGVSDRPVSEEMLARAKENGTIYVPTLTVTRGYLRLFRSAVTGEAPEVDDPHGCVDPETLAKVAATPALGAVARAAGLTPERVAEIEARVSRQEAVSAANLLAVHRAGIPIGLGTDAGNPLTLHGASVYAELEAMEAAGLSPLEVLVAATRGGAAAMGQDDQRGTVEAGKVADLLVLDADPTASAKAFRELRWVVRAGQPHGVVELSYPSGTLVSETPPR